MTTCPGTWRYWTTVPVPETEDETVELLRCSGCPDQMAIYKYRGFDVVGSTPMEAAAHAMRQYLAGTTNP